MVKYLGSIAYIIYNLIKRELSSLDKLQMHLIFLKFGLGSNNSSRVQGLLCVTLLN